MEQENQNSRKGFIPPHGGYKNLITFRQAEYIYDATIKFTGLYFRRYDRTVDQMIQAARSGKQNIVEGSMASAASKEIEIKLTSIARASLEELKNDYIDFLRLRGVAVWEKNHRFAARFAELLRIPNPTYQTFRPALEHSDAAISANAIVCLIKATSYLLKRQLEILEQEFLHKGGIRENMMKARQEYKRKLGNQRG